MPIPDPLREPVYQHGELLQQCSQCDWAQSGHGTELAACPACATPLGVPLGLRLGGFAVMFDGVRFHLHDNNGRSVILDEADQADVLRFMALHASDFRQVAPARARRPEIRRKGDLHSEPYRW